MGLLAGLVCAAGLGAAVLFQQSLPSAMMDFGGGVPISLALSLLIAALVALAIGAVRPSSLLLLPVAALYAGGAVMAGQITGSAVMIGAALRTPSANRVAGLSDVTWPTFTSGLRDALALYGAPLSESWAAWLFIAVAALGAFLLVAFRVVRVRRARRAEEAAAAEAEETREPEYRAPFEPAQQPVPKPTADLFTPRNPARD
ncbi:hypothetical protein [Nonomuraea antimicrobica]|uniref:hypothetical protein n=1 Tax=Nonomuraea antimicrobica TaxID=561173 RepID=UPI0031EF5E02